MVIKILAQNSWPKAGFLVTDKSLSPFLLLLSGPWALGLILTIPPAVTHQEGLASAPAQHQATHWGARPRVSPRLRDLSGLLLLLHGAVIFWTSYGSEWLHRASLIQVRYPGAFLGPGLALKRPLIALPLGAVQGHHKVDPLDISAGNTFLDLSSVPPGSTDIQKGV